MFERFTKSARRIVVLAQQEAYERQADRVGPEHMLTALALDDRDVAGAVLADLGLGADRIRALIAGLPSGTVTARGIDADALATLGIDLAAVREAAEREFGPGALSPGRRTRAFARLSDEAKKLLEVALREAVHRKDSSIGSEHLLLAAIRLPVGAAVVQAAGSSVQQVRDAVAAALSVRARPA